MAQDTGGHAEKNQGKIFHAATIYSKNSINSQISVLKYITVAVGLWKGKDVFLRNTSCLKFTSRISNDDFHHRIGIVLETGGDLHRSVWDSHYICRLMKQITLTPESFNELVRHRRSVFPKQFEAGKRIPDDIIQQILVNATWAPSHGNLQPWKFIVYTGDGLKRLAEFQSELYKESSGEKFNPATYEYLQTNRLKASDLFAICMKRDPNKKFPEVEEIAATSTAVQNIYLSVSAYGLGGYWTTGGITYNEKAKPFFGLEAEDKLMGFYYAGYIAVPSPDQKREPVENKVSWVRR
jgi:nitroreductase